MSREKEVAADDSSAQDKSVYSRRMLRVYDTLVYRFNMPFLWRCSVGKLNELYAGHLASNHLEVGVGTGYLLDRAQFPAPDPKITLMDLSADPLEFTASRLTRYSPQTHQADAMSAWELPSQAFESVAMSNVLHCAPGTLQDKAVAFEEARKVLAPGGVLFGSTVLGMDAEHTRRSRVAIKKLNERGVFSNLDDRLEDLDTGLDNAFDSHQIEVQGVVAIFVART